jgi:isoaspartyl peptidase/L-asparaginase-like protein (Ntn-hydrolase superfamily)
MESDQVNIDESTDLLEQHAEEIDAACKRAVREALKKHKLAGNPVAVSEDGKVVLLTPDEIEVD